MTTLEEINYDIFLKHLHRMEEIINENEDRFRDSMGLSGGIRSAQICALLCLLVEEGVVE